MTTSPIEAAMMVIDAADGKITGRTTIQKIIYFGTVKNTVQAKYRPHYYGPYSTDVAGALQTITSCHFVDEAMDTSENKKPNETFEWRRYSYSLNEEGRKVMEFLKTKYPTEFEEMQQIVRTCKQTAHLDPNILSWAAKVHYIIKQENRGMTTREISEIAGGFNWTLDKTRIDSGVTLLKELALVNG